MECEFPQRPGEEQHELQRSTKQVKESIQACSHDEEVTGIKVAPAKSYKEKLLGSILGAFAQMCTANSQQFVEEDFDSDVEKITEGVAKVKLFKETKMGIRRA